MLEKEFKFYLTHQKELVEKYNGKYLVIKEEEVVQACNTMDEAYEWGITNYELGTFLIQYCDAGKNSYTQEFHSRAIFT